MIEVGKNIKKKKFFSFFTYLTFVLYYNILIFFYVIE